MKSTEPSPTTLLIGMKSINTRSTGSKSGSKPDSTKHRIPARWCNVSGHSARFRARRRPDPATIFGPQRSYSVSLLLIWAASEAEEWADEVEFLPL